MNRPLNDNMDAQAWAEEFMKVFGEDKQRINEAVMLSWFANSIMCGFDTANNRFQARAQGLETALKVARDAMYSFNLTFRADFHQNVCKLSMGCHCKPTELDDALKAIEEILEK